MHNLCTCIRVCVFEEKDYVANRRAKEDSKHPLIFHLIYLTKCER